MIITLLLWCLVTLTSLAYGITFSKILYSAGFFSERETDFYRICLLGLALFTTLLAAISLFSPIGSIVFFSLNGLTLIQLVFYRRELIKLLTHKISRPQLWLSAGFVLIILLYAIQSDYVENDTALYHAQAIQWIEKYPAVPGLGNLYALLGYNPHFLLLSAFFSLSFTGTPFHVVNSWIVLFFCFYCIRNFSASESIKKRIINCLLLFICCFLYRWLIGLPFTDIFITILTWVIFMEILNSYEPALQNKKYNTLVLIAIIGTFALTCKLSFGILFAAILAFTIYRKLKGKL